MQTLMIVVPDNINIQKLNNEIEFLIRRNEVSSRIKVEADKIEEEARLNSLVNFCNTGKFLFTTTINLKDLL